MVLSLGLDAHDDSLSAEGSPDRSGGGFGTLSSDAQWREQLTSIIF